MKKMNLKKGFTLIELLVVVAIIGILASVVLASLNSARAKGSDAAVKANLANMRAEAAIYYDSNNTYSPTTAAPGSAACTTAGSVFIADSVMKSQLDAALAAGVIRSCSLVSGSGGAWAASVQLKSSTSATFPNATAAWCVDSTGASKAESMATNTPGGLDATVNAAGACA
jgi:prepilin-type N-terminal cleavage/methylation domain-containing protein